MVTTCSQGDGWLFTIPSSHRMQAAVDFRSGIPWILRQLSVVSGFLGRSGHGHVSIALFGISMMSRHTITITPSMTIVLFLNYWDIARVRKIGNKGDIIEQKRHNNLKETLFLKRYRSKKPLWSFRCQHFYHLAEVRNNSDLVNRTSFFRGCEMRQFIIDYLQYPVHIEENRISNRKELIFWCLQDMTIFRLAFSEYLTWAAVSSGFRQRVPPRGLWTSTANIPEKLGRKERLSEDHVRLWIKP